MCQYPAHTPAQKIYTFSNFKNFIFLDIRVHFTKNASRTYHITTHDVLLLLGCMGNKWILKRLLFAFRSTTMGVKKTKIKNWFNIYATFEELDTLKSLVECTSRNMHQKASMATRHCVPSQSVLTLDDADANATSCICGMVPWRTKSIEIVLVLSLLVKLLMFDIK